MKITALADRHFESVKPEEFMHYCVFSIKACLSGGEASEQLAYSADWYTTVNHMDTVLIEWGRHLRDDLRFHRDLQAVGCVDDIISVTQPFACRVNAFPNWWGQTTCRGWRLQRTRQKKTPTDYCTVRRKHNIPSVAVCVDQDILLTPTNHLDTMQLL